MPALLFSELKAAAIQVRDAMVRDWQVSSWMYPGAICHPIHALGASIEGACPGLGAAQLFEGDYAAAKESKLQSWERSSTRAIEQWDPQKAASLMAIFPGIAPKEYAGYQIVARHTRNEWTIDFIAPALIAPLDAQMEIQQELSTNPVGNLPFAGIDNAQAAREFARTGN